MQFTSLGSGSKGNATIFKYRDRCILIDSGFSCKQLVLRLEQRRILPESIDAVLVTHEHSDHFNGVPVFANRFDVPVWMSHGTSLHDRASKIANLKIFNPHQSFQVGDFDIQPVLVPHDAREACQFIVRAGGCSVGLLTDLGHITPYVSRQYQDCDGLLLEFNHDRQMLAEGRYSPSLKSRVGGSLGHLSNSQARDFLQHCIPENLKFLAAMHISEENNCQQMVSQYLQEFEGEQLTTLIAQQDTGFDWQEI